MRRAAFFTALGLAGLASAQTDILLSTSRMAGMGGAGLALAREVGLAGRFNPALYAKAGKGAKIWFPEIGYELNGITDKQLRDLLKKADQAGLDATTVAELANKYGDTRKDFGALAALGWTGGGFAINMDGSVNVASLPNASLQAWSQGGAQGAPPSDAQLDAYGYGFASVNFGYGRTVASRKGLTFDVGAQVRFIKSYFSHYYTNAVQIAATNGIGLPAQEMGGNNALSGRSTGVDLGFLVTLPDEKTTFGGSWLNFVEPKAGFTRTLPNQDQTSVAPLLSQDFNPFRKQLNFGLGHVANDKLAFAFDVVDAGNNNGRLSYRGGADFTLSRGFGLRLGYDTRTKGTVGFSAFGLNFAFAKQNPFSLSTALRF